MAAHVNAAGHRHERGAGHPVGGGRHAVKHLRHPAPGDIIGVDLGGPGEPANGGVNHNREGDKQNPDGVRRHAELFQDGHQNDEDQEAAGIEAVNARQIVDEIAVFFQKRHHTLPYASSAWPQA